MDVNVKATLSGFTEAEKQAKDLAKGVDAVTEATNKSTEASNAATKSAENLGAARRAQLLAAREQAKAEKAAAEALAESNKAALAQAKSLFDLTGGGRAAIDSTRTLNEAMSTLSNVGIAAGVAGLAAAGTAATWAGAKVLEAVDQVRKLGDEYYNMSMRTGIAVEELSSWSVAAKTSNTSMAELSHGLNLFNRYTADLAKGTKDGTDAFTRMGIEVKNSDGSLKNSGDLIKEVAEKFSGYKDGAAKAALAMELFGRAGVNLIPFLNQGAAGLAQMQEEARKAGIVMSTETAEAAQKLNENLEVLKSYGQGFWQAVASPIVEGLAKVTQEMRRAKKEGEGFFSTMYEGAKKLFEVVFLPSTKGQLENTLEQIPQVIANITKIQTQLTTGLDDRGRPLTPSQRSVLESRLESSRANLDSLHEQRRELEAQRDVEDGSAMAGPKTDAPDPKSKDKKGKVGRVQTVEQMGNEIAAYYKTLLDEGAIFREDYVALMDLLAENWKDNEQLRSKYSAQAAQERNKIINEETKAYLNALRRQEAEWADIERKAEKEHAKQKAAISSINDKAAKAELDNISKTTFMFKEDLAASIQAVIDKYEAMGEAGQKGAERAKGAMEALSSGAKQANVIVQDVSVDMTQLWKDVYKGVEGFFGQLGRYALGMKSQFTSIGDAIKGFFSSIAGSVLDMFAKVAANAVFRWIFNGGGTGGMGLGSLFGLGGSSPGSGMAGGFNPMSVVGGAANIAGMSGSGGGAGGGGIGSWISNAGSSIRSFFGGPAIGSEEAMMGAMGGGNGGFLSGLGGSAGALGVAGFMAMGLMDALSWGEGTPKWQMTPNERFAAMMNGGYFTATQGPYAGQRGYMGGADIFTTNPLTGLPYPAGTVWDDSSPVRLPYDANGNRIWHLGSDGYPVAMATGGDSVVTKPTLFMAGEAGAERVTVSPIGAAHRREGGSSINFNAPVIMDVYQMKRFKKMLDNA